MTRRRRLVREWVDEKARKYSEMFVCSIRDGTHVTVARANTAVEARKRAEREARRWGSQQQRH